jgi:hypothetical protein
LTQPDFDGLVRRFRRPGLGAVALMGSFARGDAGQFSDVDLVLFTGSEEKERTDPESHRVEGRLVVVSEVTPGELERWFSEPELATACLGGLRDARALWDPEGTLRMVQERARRFVWDSFMQTKADAYASRRMVDWIEEVHKGLEGLRTGDVGRLLNARYGLSWGLTQIMRVQRGVILSGDNDSYPAVAESLGPDSDWTRLSRKAFGIEGTEPLDGQVRAGLRLYALSARLLADVLEPADRDMIEHTVQLLEGQM